MLQVTSKSDQISALKQELADVKAQQHKLPVPFHKTIKSSVATAEQAAAMMTELAVSLKKQLAV